MIVKRHWRKGYFPTYTYYTGWFLFGFIPLYIYQHE